MATAPAPAPPPNSPFWWKRILFALVALCALLYLGDFAWYQVRLLTPRFGPAKGSVHRIRLLAISSKGNKIDYEIDAAHPEEDVPCTHSIFPHGGNPTCWYMVRHANDPIPM